MISKPPAVRSTVAPFAVSAPNAPSIVIPSMMISSVASAGSPPVPGAMITDNTGAAPATIKATSGPQVSLQIDASKTGFTSTNRDLTLDVSGFTIIATEEFLGVPSWVMYLTIVGAVGGGVAVVYFIFLKKPKEVGEEEEEEEEI